MTDKRSPLIATTLGLFVRGVFGALIALAFVMAAVGFDYLQQVDRRYYFMDREASIMTLLVAAPCAGAIVGLSIGVIRAIANRR